MSLPYYPMYPRDFYEGTQEMSLELKGAYIMVLNLMYTRGGPVSDEPGFISRYVGCSIRKWKQLRDELVGMGKLSVENEMICNSRADEELEKQRSYRDQQAENRGRPNKNKAEESRTREEPEPSPKPEPQVDVGMVVETPNQNEFDTLEANCRKWANGSLNLVEPAAHDLGPIIRLLKPAAGSVPCTIDDVRSGITRVAAGLHAKGEQVGTFKYFTKAIIRERDERLTPLPKPELVHETAANGRPAGAYPGANGSRSHGAGAGSSRSGYEPRSGNLASAAARLRAMRQDAAAVSDEPEDGGDDWVARGSGRNRIDVDR